MQAIVLAGQRNRAFTALSDVSYEALVPVAGRPMVDYVLDALLAARAVDGIVMVGPPRGLDGVNEVPPGPSLWDNLAAGLGRLDSTDDSVLVVTSDIPLIDGRMVDGFVEAAPPADLVYPVISKADTVAKFPGTERTYVRLRGAPYTGGNLVLARPRALARVRERAEKLVAHRKAPVKLALDVGPLLLLKFLLGRLSLAEAERRVSAVFDIEGRVVVSRDPEIGVDVDKPSDLALVEQVLAGRGRTMAGSAEG